MIVSQLYIISEGSGLWICEMCAGARYCTHEETLA